MFAEKVVIDPKIPLFSALRRIRRGEGKEGLGEIL